MALDHSATEPDQHVFAHSLQEPQPPMYEGFFVLLHQPDRLDHIHKQHRGVVPNQHQRGLCGHDIGVCAGYGPLGQLH